MDHLCAAATPPGRAGRLSWAPARDNDERLVGLRWRLRDLTAQQTGQETLAQHVRELTAKLDQAEWRMRELNHRMKNNLQVVASLLDWQGESPGPARPCDLPGMPGAPSRHGPRP